jgi:hypothetical protein
MARTVAKSEMTPVRQMVDAGDVGKPAFSRGAAAALAVVPDGEELAADDGTSDGRGLVEDGLMMVVRLTPANYPARLTSIRVYFVQFEGEPSPVGKSIRLVAFGGKGPEPPASPRFLVDTKVKVPSIGAYVDFAIADPPEITEGDFFVGYQSPIPSTGIGFATDTSGPQSERSFWSEDGGGEWGGPLEFMDGSMANAMIRARVASTTPDSGDFELRTDDGTVEAGLLRDGGIYVNRFTPPRYPVTLHKVRVFVAKMTDQPTPEGKPINLIVFRDPAGGGTPPGNPAMDVRKTATLGARMAFTEVEIPPVLVESGDVYVGFESPKPARRGRFRSRYGRAAVPADVPVARWRADVHRPGGDVGRR